MGAATRPHIHVVVLLVPGIGGEVQRVSLQLFPTSLDMEPQTEFVGFPDALNGLDCLCQDTFRAKVKNQNQKNLKCNVLLGALARK